MVYYKAAQSKNSTGIIIMTLHATHYHDLSLTGYRWLVLSLVLCTCSALSKETGITAIAVCLAMDYLLIQQVVT